MNDDLEDIGDAKGLDDSEASSANEKPLSTLSEKQQAQADLETRRRLELRLEEVRIQKKMQEYDFDDDFA